MLRANLPVGDDILITDPPEKIRVGASFRDCLGWSDYTEIELTVNYPLPPLLYSMSASPNPVNTILNINITSNEDVLQNQSNLTMSSGGTALAASPVCEIKLFNITGSQVRHTSSQIGSSIALDVSGLPNGLYILHVHDGTNNPPLTQNIIVYH
jgi:hypothetical protein